MKFVLKPSLEHMALVKIAVSLWNQNDIRYLMMKHNSPSYFATRDEKWKKIEERVIEKVPMLPLPQLLKEKMLGFIKPIGLEISTWKEYNRKHFHVNLPAELCWTPQGTVDRKKTAKALVSNEKLDISTCYEIACIYCLEDDIIRFWNSMSEDLKESVLLKFPIISFWSRNMLRKELGIGNTRIVYRNIFLKSVCWNNRIVAEYFLQKLNPREREESLVEAAKKATDDDTLCFLISEMNEEQQMEVFKINPYRLLRCFLKWPLQSFFIETANCMWDFLSKEHYDLLLSVIIGKVSDGYKDWNYQELFKEFWHRSPAIKKSLIINNINNSWVLSSLFRIKDSENIKLILNDSNLTAKEKLIYNRGINDLCERSIHENKWDFLEFFIRECLPSKNAMLKFKEKFEKRYYFQECSATKKHKWNQLFSFLDDSICNYGKRSIEEGESFSSKQFRSLE